MQGTINLFKAVDNMGTLDLEDLDISLFVKGMAAVGGAAAHDLGGGAGDEEEDLEGQPAAAGGGGKGNDQENGIIVGTDDVLELFVTEKDKNKEEKEREQKIDDLSLLKHAFLKKLNQFKNSDDQVSKDKLRMKMMSITDEMENLREEKMTEQKFWGLLALDDD